MISAGNDIVSLEAVNVTRSKSPEFYAKILHPAEEKLYNTLDPSILPFVEYVWLLWSVKESAYKYLRRLDHTTPFIPVRLEVQSVGFPPGFARSSIGTEELTGCGFASLATVSGSIIFEGITLFYRTLFYNELIASVVNDSDNFEDIHWGLKWTPDRTYAHQSALVREFAVGSLQLALGLSGLVIDKNELGVPIVLKDVIELDMPISLSHHGVWVGYSFNCTQKK